MRKRVLRRYCVDHAVMFLVQGDPLEWVSSHWYHHQHCDTEKDPHSPYEGFWQSHMGWLLDDRKNTRKSEQDFFIPSDFDFSVFHYSSNCSEG